MEAGQLAPQKTLVLVGCGNMGYALLRGWVQSDTFRASIHVVEPQAALRDRAASLGVSVHTGPETLQGSVSAIVIALKPQALPTLLPLYERFSDEALLVSIAAGVPLAKLGKLLGGGRVVRAMPNTPSSIGKGSTVFVSGPGVSFSDAALVTELFIAAGKVHEVTDEKLMDAVTAISGSGPAYVFYFIECLSAAAREIGLSDDLANQLARETVYGAGALAFEAEVGPEELRRQVTSPRGTTEAALQVLSAEGVLEKLLIRTTKAALKRSRDLSLE